MDSGAEIVAEAAATIVGGEALIGVAAKAARLVRAAWLARGLSAASRAAFANGANEVVARGGVTAVGRAIQRHAVRPGSFFRAGKNAAENAQIGANFVESLLTNPSAAVSRFGHQVHGAVVNVRLPSGVGAQFGKAGNFIGLLERFTPR